MQDANTSSDTTTQGETQMSEQATAANGDDNVKTLDFAALAEQDELSDDDVLAILAGGREKGIYDDAIVEFVRGGKIGVPYKFTGKKAASVKTGFESAK